MTTVALIYALSRPVHYVGYTFQLSVRPLRGCMYVGYFVTSCESRRRDKKTAFELGFWTEKRPQAQTSSVDTPLLVGVPLFDNTDEELHHSLTTLLRYLVEQFGYQPPENVVTMTINTTYSDVTPLSIA